MLRGIPTRGERGGEGLRFIPAAEGREPAPRARNGARPRTGERDDAPGVGVDRVARRGEPARAREEMGLRFIRGDETPPRTAHAPPPSSYSPHAAAFVLGLIVEHVVQRVGRD